MLCSIYSESEKGVTGKTSTHTVGFDEDFVHRLAAENWCRGNKRQLSLLLPLFPLRIHANNILPDVLEF